MMTTSGKIAGVVYLARGLAVSCGLLLIASCAGQSAKSPKPVVVQSNEQGEIANRKSVAVLPCTAMRPITSDQAIQARDFLEEELARNRSFRIVDRSEIDKVLSESTLALQGVTNSRKAADVGGFVGANYVLTSKLSMSGEKYVIACRLIDTANGTVENSAIGKVTHISKLDGAAKGCIRRLLNLM